ncbi:hypothetical protein [Planosporangium mesophilum]|uniref:hypothetical protein n=1 Tax=Planosporangium mesophilum TaxID=689768 RepID=UPI00143B214C|nr:hypothetical protein [Planosporangium mesophilum]NJC85773.1 hypothetical protein [Planosporangium mesophilum]
MTGEHGVDRGLVRHRRHRVRFPDHEGQVGTDGAVPLIRRYPRRPTADDLTEPPAGLDEKPTALDEFAARLGGAPLLRDDGRGQPRIRIHAHR